MVPRASPVSPADLTSAVTQSLLDSYISVACSILLFYEYLLTLDDEIEFFWNWSKRSEQTWKNRLLANFYPAMYFLNRYGNLLCRVEDIIYKTQDLGEMECKLILITGRAWLVLMQIIVCAITGFRVYSIYERSKVIGCCFALIFPIGFGASLWIVLNHSSQHTRLIVPANFGCHPEMSNAEGLKVSAPWITLFFYDTFIFSLTLWKALKQWRYGNSRLLQILVRDGAIFFVIMALANLATILTLILAPPFAKAASVAFTNVVSVITVSRLMVNLRKPQILIDTPQRSGQAAEVDTDIALSTLCAFTNQFRSESSGATESITGIGNSSEAGEEDRA